MSDSESANQKKRREVPKVKISLFLAVITLRILKMRVGCEKAIRKITHADSNGHGALHYHTHHPPQKYRGSVGPPIH